MRCRFERIGGSHDSNQGERARRSRIDGGGNGGDRSRALEGASLRRGARYRRKPAAKQSSEIVDAVIAWPHADRIYQWLYFKEHIRIYATKPGFLIRISATRVSVNFSRMRIELSDHHVMGGLTAL